MLIIHWLSTEIRLFAHLKNLALIACFAGLGLGYAMKHWRVSMVFPLVAMAVWVLASQPAYIVSPLTLKHLSRIVSFDNVYSWQPISDLPSMVLGMAILLIVFTLVVFIFVPFGQFLGDLFRSSKNLLADYTLNLIASVLGILAFTALCVLNIPPFFWFLLGLTPLIFLIPKSKYERTVGIATLGIILFIPLVLGQRSYGVIEVTWSPYQKIQVWRIEAVPSEGGVWKLRPAAQDQGNYPMFMMDVNDTAMMWMMDMSGETLEKYPGISPKGKIEWYDFPYRIFPSPERVLVVGSGGGNDVAAALRHGAKIVDAVEIDPVILKLGLKYHQEKPYQNPRVNKFVTDARRFFHTTPFKYDVIVFGQLDNTDYNLMSNFSNIRMDSYIYTLESFQSAWHLLKPGGIIVINFGSNDWWGNRVTKLLKEATGQKPLGYRNDLQLFFPGQENTYVSGNLSLVEEAIKRDSEFAAWAKQRQANWNETPGEPSITDDWPYWFLSRRAIPTLHLVIIGFILILSFTLAKICLPESGKFEGHFFFLGAAFMLLEVQLINKIALLFGSTWMVNAAVIASILVMIVAANTLVALRGSISRRWVYIFLGISLAVQWLIPPSRFLNMQHGFSIFAALVLYSLPVFFAGLIFARSFKNTEAPDLALSSNLMGSISGGLLESTSYIFGMNFLIGISLGLYVLSGLFLLKKQKQPLIPNSV